MNTKARTLQDSVPLYATYLLYASAFLVPFLLGHPQLLVGSLVNMLLVLAALSMPRKQWLPFALLPSLGVIARGLIFGPFTALILFFVPFIWAGNLLLMWAMDSLRAPLLGRLGVGAALKAALLFAVAFGYVQFSVVPAAFLTAMGIVQVQTALIGGLSALVIVRLWDR